MRTLALLLAVALVAAACNREGPAEKAGRSIDNAAKDVRDAVQGKK
jgi:predicted small secreted protein